MANSTEPKSPCGIELRLRGSREGAEPPSAAESVWPIAAHGPFKRCVRPVGGCLMNRCIGEGGWCGDQLRGFSDKRRFSARVRFRTHHTEVRAPCNRRQDRYT